MSIGTRISALIEEREITQKQLSKILKVAPSTISGYITKGREPDVETLIKLASYFNVSIDYLVNFSTKISESTDNILSESENELIHVYRSLSQYERELLIEQGKLLNRLSSKYDNIP